MIPEKSDCAESKINDLLKHIAKLTERINICPPAQLEALLKQLNNENHRYDPWLEAYSNFLLRWSVFAAKTLKEQEKLFRPSQEGENFKDSEEYHRWFGYFNKCEVYKKLLKNHTQKNNAPSPHSNTEIDLPTSTPISTILQITDEQYHLIFYQTLLKNLSEHIEESFAPYQKNSKKPPLHFSAETILNKALSSFEAWMIKEVLCQFETVSLVERAAMLEAKIAASMPDFFNNHETITQETKPELRVIRQQLAAPSTDFKFNASNELYIYLLASKTTPTINNTNSESNYSESICNFLNQKNEKDESKTKADENIDTAFCIPDSHVKLRSIATFFRSARKSETEITDYVSEEMKRLTPYKNLTIPKLHSAASEEKTTDTRLLQLREVISAYQEVLIDIAKTEGHKYKYRSIDSINKRSIAVDELHNAVNKAKTLNRDTINTVKRFIDTIKSCDPHWRELYFLQKLLDIITFGYRALSRWRALHEKAEVKKLYTTVNALQTMETNEAISPTLAEHSF